MAKPPIRIPRVLVKPTLRLAFLRLILIVTSAILYFIVQDWDTAYSTMILVGLTLVHNFTSALGPNLIPLYTWMDLLLTAGEFGYCVYLSIYWSPDFNFRIAYVDGTIGEYLSIYTLTVLLGCLSLLKALYVTDTRGTTLFGHANILARSSGTAGDATTAPWRYFLRVIVGTRLWKRILPGEGRWIAVLRGSLALAAIFGLLGFSLAVVLLGPLTEIGLTPTREYRALQRGLGIPMELPSISAPSVWNLVVVWQARENAPESLTRMLTLKSMWQTQAGTDFPSQVIKGSYFEPYEATPVSAQWQMMMFDCNISLPWFPAAHVALPDLLLRVNFSGLPPPDRPLGSGRYIPDESLKVYSAFTDNTEDVLATTRPVLLLPGMNLMAVVDLVIRKRFRTPELSAFGLFDVYDTFAIAEMASIVPMSGTVSPEDMDPNISTLHITYQGPPREWRVIQDYREKSVLSGLSAAGGLGSFLSLLCAVLFGTPLFSVLFRAKPFSAFGILHSLENQREGLASACKKKYPKLEAELRAFEAEENRGVQALLLNTLLDLDLIREQVTKAQSSVSSSDMESGMDGSPVTPAPTTRAERASEQGA